MLMKKIGIYLSAVVMLAMVAACAKNEAIEGNGHGFDEATFKVEATSVENTKATFTITSTGATGATYFGFLTEDMESKASDLVAAALKGVNVTRHMLSSGTTTVTEEDLRQGGKAYRYIVSGLLSNGATYNEPVFVEINTTGDFVEDSEGVISYPNPVSEPTTVKFSGFPGKFIYGFTESEITAEDIKLIANSDLDSGVKPVEEEATATLAISEEGTYYVYAYELDENNEPTLSYTTFKLEIGNLDFSGYDAFLGEWYLNGVEDDIITIKENKRGASYTISGDILNLPTGIKEIEAAYSLASNTLIISEQVLEKYTSANYGPCWRVFGGFNDGQMSPSSLEMDTDPQVVATATAEADGTIVITPEEGFDGMGYYWVILEGANAGKGNWNDPVSLPNKLMADPAEPTDAYNAWIGTWYDEANYEFEIKKYKTNTAYLMTGFDQAEENPFEVVVNFDEATGGIVFFGQVVGNTSTAEYDFCGMADNGYLYYNGIVATGELSEDKKTCTITGASGTDSEGKAYSFYALRILTYSSGWGAYANAKIVELPAVLANEKHGPTPEYAKWLGEWEIERIPATDTDPAVTDTWTIKEKVVNGTFTVTGVEGSPFEVEATFDNETSALSIAKQTVFSSQDDQKNNVFKVDLLGNILYGGKVYTLNGTYDVFNAIIGEDGKAALVPTTAGPYGDFIGFRLYGYVGSNTSSVAYSSAGTPLPNVLVPVENADETPTSLNSVSFDTFVPVDIKSLGQFVANGQKTAPLQEGPSRRVIR